jgi:hypothetical protein
MIEMDSKDHLNLMDGSDGTGHRRISQWDVDPHPLQKPDSGPGPRVKRNVDIWDRPRREPRNLSRKESGGGGFLQHSPLTSSTCNFDRLPPPLFLFFGDS